MRIETVVAVGLFLCSAVAGAGAQERFELYVAVVNAADRTPVDELGPADVVIEEDGQNARILKITPVNRPVKLQILVDNGRGLGGENLQLLKDGLTNLVDALPEGLEITLVTTPQPRFLARASTSREDLDKGLSRLGATNDWGRFVQSMRDARQRIEEDDSDHYPVIVSVGTTLGDSNVQQRDFDRVFEALHERPITIHVVVLQRRAMPGTGDVQQEVGEALAQSTGGRYQFLTRADPLPDLLADIGRRIADTHRASRRMYRLTLERPEGKSGSLGRLAASASPGKILTSLSLDGRVLN
jgi:hypothetical protein